MHRIISVYSSYYLRVCIESFVCIQAGYQILVLVVSLVVAAMTGGISGAVLRMSQCAEPMDNYFYEDAG